MGAEEARGLWAARRRLTTCRVRGGDDSARRSSGRGVDARDDSGSGRARAAGA